MKISIPNQKQRKGRVGRIKPGKVYYTYDITTLNKEVIYKICIEDITDKILDLITSTNERLIDKSNDPYKIKDIQFKNKRYVIINI